MPDSSNSKPSHDERYPRPESERGSLSPEPGQSSTPSEGEGQPCSPPKRSADRVLRAVSEKLQTFLDALRNKSRRQNQQLLEKEFDVRIFRKAIELAKMDPDDEQRLLQWVRKCVLEKAKIREYELGCLEWAPPDGPVGIRWSWPEMKYSDECYLAICDDEKKLHEHPDKLQADYDADTRNRPLKRRPDVDAKVGDSVPAIKWMKRFVLGERRKYWDSPTVPTSRAPPNFKLVGWAIINLVSPKEPLQGQSLRIHGGPVVLEEEIGSPERIGRQPRREKRFFRWLSPFGSFNTILKPSAKME